MTRLLRLLMCLTVLLMVSLPAVAEEPPDNAHDMANFEQLHWVKTSYVDGPDFSLTSEYVSSGDTSLRVDMNQAFWLMLEGTEAVTANVTETTEAAKVVLDIYGARTPFYAYLGNVQVYVKPASRNWWDYAGQVDLYHTETTPAGLQRYTVSLNDYFTQMVKAGPVNIRLAFNPKWEDTTFWLDRLLLCDEDGPCCDSYDNPYDLQTCYEKWDADVNFLDVSMQSWSELGSDGFWNIVSFTEAETVVMPENEEDPLQTLETASGGEEEVVLDCTDGDDECDDLTAATEMTVGNKVGVSPEYCREIEVVRQLSDCSGNPVYGYETVYQEVSSAENAMELGCKSVPGILPLTKCSTLETSRNGENVAVECAEMEGFDEVADLSTNDDYNDCMTQMNDEALCSRLAQDCYTVVHCPDDYYDDQFTQGDPVATDIISAGFTEAVGDITEPTQPPPVVANPDKVQFYPCKNDEMNYRRVGSGFGQFEKIEPDTDSDSSATLQAGLDGAGGILNDILGDESIIDDNLADYISDDVPERFDFLKGSDKWGIYYNAGYNASNGFQKGALAEGASVGLNADVDAEFGAKVFGKQMPIINANAGVAAGACKMGMDFDFKLFGTYTPDNIPTIHKKFPNNDQAIAQCESAMEGIADAKAKLNDYIWKYKAIRDYFLNYAEDGLVTVEDYVNNTAEEIYYRGTNYLPGELMHAGLTFDWDKVMLERDRLQDEFEQAYAAAAQEVADKVAAVYDGADQGAALFEQTIFDLGNESDDNFTIRSPELEKSIPIGPFSLVVAGQVAGGVHLRGTALLSMELKDDLPNVMIPVPVPSLGVEFEPGVDVGGWVFAGVGISFGIGGASVGIRGTLSLIDIGFPVGFAFGLEPKVKENTSNVIEWGIGFSRLAKMDMTILAGKIDLEVRAWIKILWKKFKKSWRKNITSWKGFQFSKTLDEDEMGWIKVLETPNFLTMPSFDPYELIPDGVNPYHYEGFKDPTLQDAAFEISAAQRGLNNPLPADVKQDIDEFLRVNRDEEEDLVEPTESPWEEYCTIYVEVE
ncbi:MAG: hypothetical protein JXR76_11265 [Deltaproteobacteria bacterium]|nr:hypothetical protein [Deltaproteobacteria bacterium]